MCKFSSKYLEVPSLGKVFVAVVQLAHEPLHLAVDFLVGPDIASLGERLVTHCTLVRPIPSMSARMGL